MKKFADEYVINPNINLIDEFVRKHYRQPVKYKVVIGIEKLQVARSIKLNNITLYPLKSVKTKYPQCEQIVEASSVALLDMVGTRFRDIKKRSVLIIEHELRMLRIMLRKTIAINDKQLRFRVGRESVVINFGFGVSQHKDVGYNLKLNHKLLKDALDESFSAKDVNYNLLKLHFERKNKLNSNACLRAYWLEQAQKSVDEKMTILYYIFSLETILGKKDEKDKGSKLAFRYTLLSHIVSGSLFNYSAIPYFYQIRSDIVHGEQVRAISNDAIKTLKYIARDALSQYLCLARDNKFKTPREIIEYIDNHRDSSKFREKVSRADSS